MGAAAGSEQVDDTRESEWNTDNLKLKPHYKKYSNLENKSNIISDFPS